MKKIAMVLALMLTSNCALAGLLSVEEDSYDYKGHTRYLVITGWMSLN